MKKKLSPRQQQILDLIRDFIDEYHFPPTVRDIQTGCDISSTSVVDYNLHILQREGYLRRLPEVSRGLELLDGSSERSKRNVARVPLLGNIAAGEPLPIPSDGSWHVDPLDNLDMPLSLTKGRSSVYALRVKGTSMIDALVADGDLVLIEPVPQVENGDMVAAWLTDRDEATLKRFYLEGDTVRLQPANDTMAPINVPAEHVAVRGRVVGVVRQL
jgi:repressor LexA